MAKLAGIPNVACASFSFAFRILLCIADMKYIKYLTQRKCFRIEDAYIITKGKLCFDFHAELADNIGKLRSEILAIAVMVPTSLVSAKH